MNMNIGAILKSSDNSGIKKLKNINILNKNKKLKINNTSISVVKKGRNIKLRIKKSDLVNALIVGTRCYNFFKYKGTRLNRNSAVVFYKNDKCFTKIKGLVSSVVKDSIYKLKVNLNKVKFI